MRPSKFQLERDITDRFLRELGYTHFALSDPNAGQKTETGADVLLGLNGIRYGIQVTQYHSDEGMNGGTKGSTLRREEANKSAVQLTYAMCGNPSPIMALKRRIEAKSQKQCLLAKFDERILL